MSENKTQRKKGLILKADTRRKHRAKISCVKNGGCGRTQVLACFYVESTLI